MIVCMFNTIKDSENMAARHWTLTGQVHFIAVGASVVGRAGALIPIRHRDAVESNPRTRVRGAVVDHRLAIQSSESDGAVATVGVPESLAGSGIVLTGVRVAPIND